MIVLLCARACTGSIIPAAVAADQLANRARRARACWLSLICCGRQWRRRGRCAPAALPVAHSAATPASERASRSVEACERARTAVRSSANSALESARAATVARSSRRGRRVTLTCNKHNAQACALHYSTLAGPLPLLLGCTVWLPLVALKRSSARARARKVHKQRLWRWAALVLVLVLVLV